MGVLSGRLFGMVEIDIQVPCQWTPHFIHLTKAAASCMYVMLLRYGYKQTQLYAKLDCKSNIAFACFHYEYRKAKPAKAKQRMFSCGLQVRGFY